MLLVYYSKCSTCRKAKRWLEEQYGLPASDGMLVKRPVLVTDRAVLTGFREKEWEKLL